MITKMKKTDEIYTKKEMEELKAWFSGTKLPASMQLDKATFIPDLKDTIGRLLQQADLCYENPKLQGVLRLLERIKAKLTEGENAEQQG